MPRHFPPPGLVVEQLEARTVPAGGFSPVAGVALVNGSWVTEVVHYSAPTPPVARPSSEPLPDVRTPPQARFTGGAARAFSDASREGVGDIILTGGRTLSTTARGDSPRFPAGSTGGRRLALGDVIRDGVPESPIGVGNPVPVTPQAEVPASRLIVLTPPTRPAVGSVEPAAGFAQLLARGRWPESSRFDPVPEFHVGVYVG